MGKKLLTISHRKIASLTVYNVRLALLKPTNKECISIGDKLVKSHGRNRLDPNYRYKT